MPRLSVVIPTFNSEKTIEKCLRSIRSSFYPDYELIVVDSASSDNTKYLAAKFADRVIELDGEPNRCRGRRLGFKHSSGSILVNIDSDVLIRPDTLSKISEYFLRNPQVSAVTGILSKKNPYDDLFSQYKNLYLHHTFSRMPKSITFLYGSIYAFRSDVAGLCTDDTDLASDDTAFGQRLFSRGKEINLLKDLEVTHLRRFTPVSLLKNDFKVPFEWGKIFVRYRGWQQLCRNRVGYAHAPVGQLISLVISISLLFVLFAFPPGHRAAYLYGLAGLWLLLNAGFTMFLRKEKGALFAGLCVPVIFIDNIIMASGAFCGIINALFIRVKNKK